MSRLYKIILLVFLLNQGFAQESLCPIGNDSPTFDWTQQYFTIYLDGLAAFPIQAASPFYARSLNSPYNSNNVNALDVANQTGWRDFLPSEGWRLVARNFGTPTERTNYPHDSNSIQFSTLKPNISS